MLCLISSAGEETLKVAESPALEVKNPLCSADEDKEPGCPTLASSQTDSTGWSVARDESEPANAADRRGDDDTEMTCQGRIRTGQTCATEAREAVREFHAAVAQHDMALVTFFCSAQYDLAALALELSDVFAGVQVVGCTTAGEFGPAGYRERSIAGASFPASSFTAASRPLTALQQFEVTQGHSLAQDLVQTLSGLEPAADADNTFALLMIDGLSAREEAVTHALQTALGGLSLVGGSAADGLSFDASYVYFDGSFHADSAVLVLVTTLLPFKTFKTQHFVPTHERVVVTAADAERRIVSEIDGWRAAEAYAHLIGASVTSLDPRTFSTEPMVVLIDGTNYVRAIQKANSDGGLTFFCAVEEGMVLRRAHGVDLVGDLERAFAEIRAAIGQPQLVVGFDCFLRKLEIADHGLIDRVETVFCDNNVVGFNSYGEQYGGIHVNQTLAGIAIAEGSDG